jgi:hypothetical protein
VPDLPHLYFLHIPKTAGTSVARVLRSFYPRGQVLPAHNRLELGRLPADSVDKHLCILGHHGPLPYALTLRPLTVITILRDPVERVVSEVEYVRQQIRAKTGDFVRHPVASHIEKPLEELLTVPEVRTALTEHQTRVLGIRPEPALVRFGVGAYSMLCVRGQARRLGDDALLVRAKQHLDTMAAVGTVARMDETMSVICHVLGVPTPETVPRARVGPNRDGRTHRERIGPELAAELDKMNVRDHELVAYADGLLTQHLAQIASGEPRPPRPRMQQYAAPGWSWRLGLWWQVLLQRLRP